MMGPVRRKVVQGVVLAAPVVAVVVGAWSRRWTSDDGFINFRIVDQVFAGHGPVYNAGERVEVGTSPLWLGVVVGLRAVLGWLTDQAWLAVMAGIGLTGAALALAERGARDLLRVGAPPTSGQDECGLAQLRPPRSGRGPFLVPAGVVIVAALSPFWDFATAGLELGLAFAWLAGCFAGLARRASISRGGRRRSRWPRWLDPLALLVGLGPLVRPDFALYTAGFAAALLWSGGREQTGKARALTVAQVVAAPVAFQAFRMGFFAAVVPNTALAKNAAGADWGQGLFYLGDYLHAYALAIPLVCLVPLWARAATATNQAGRRLLVCLLAATVTHVLYVVRLGGDFMHARFLLVPTLALCLPVAVVPMTRRAGDRPSSIGSARGRLAAVNVAAVTGVGVWALVAAMTLRPPAAARSGPHANSHFANHGVIDERHFWVRRAQRAHPVMLDDYRADFRWITGEQLRQARAAHRDLALELPGPPRPGVSVLWGNIGITGERAGTDVHIYDSYSLADPVGSRLTSTLGHEGRPGHSKAMPPAWAAARATLPSRLDDVDAQSARRALACGALRRLRDDVSAPLTPVRFLHNLWRALPDNGLEVNRNPTVAARQFCRE